MLFKTLLLRQGIRISKGLSPAQKLFQHVDTAFQLREDGVRMVRMKTEHITAVLPMFKTFCYSEITVNSVGIEFGDEHLYPLLFNVTRDPHSFLLLKDDELVGHVLQSFMYRNIEDDPNPIPMAQMNLKKDDKFHVLDGVLHYFESKAFELNPSADRMVHMLASYATPEYQGTGILKDMGRPIIKDNLKLAARGFHGILGISTRKASEASATKSGFDILHKPSREVYNKLNGSPVEFTENGDVASLVYMDFKKFMESQKIKK